MNAARTGRLGLLIAMVAASTAAADDGVTDVYTALDARRGEVVVVMLRSGATLEGKVTGLSSSLVSLSGLKSGHEAHVRLDDVSAVLVSARKGPVPR